MTGQKCENCGKPHSNKKYCSQECAQFQPTDKASTQKYRSKEWIQQKYYGEKLSTTEMADLADCDPSTIQYWMDKFGFDRRSMSNAKTESKPYTDGEWLETKYIKEGYSTSKLAEICECTRSTIRFWLKRYDIKTRPRGGVTEYEIEEDWLKSKYTDEKMTSPEIAEEIGCHENTVRHRLRSLNIPIRKNAGEHHHRWKGGVTPLHEKIRKSDKYLEWRDKVFQRDNYTCQWCKAKGDVEADHIFPFSYILEDNKIETLQKAKQCTALWDIENGRTLCEDCHKATPTYGHHEQYNKNELQQLDRQAKKAVLQDEKETKAND